MPIPDISLALVFYNEERNIEEALPPLIKALEHSRYKFQLVLVDDGSTDRTGPLLESVAKGDRRLKVIHSPRNQGKGSAVLRGLKEANGKYIGYSDGDGQVAPADVLRVFAAISHGQCDLAMAHRVVREDGMTRRFISWCYNLYMHVLYRCHVSDHSASPKIFSRELLPILDLHCSDWFIDPEIMIKSKALHLKITQIPIVFHARKGGQSKITFATLLEFAWHILVFPFNKNYRKWRKRILPKWQPI